MKKYNKFCKVTLSSTKYYRIEEYLFDDVIGSYWCIYLEATGERVATVYNQNLVKLFKGM